MKTTTMRLSLLAAGVMLACGAVHADEKDTRAIAERLVDEHFQESTLTREQQIEELIPAYS